MVKSCCVSNCKTDAKSGSPKVFLYQVPNNKKLRFLWNKAIGRKDRDIKSSEYVCDKHFKSDEFTNFLKSGQDTNKFKKPQLSTKAIPSIFPTLNNKKSPTLEMESYGSEEIPQPTEAPLALSLDEESDSSNTKPQQKPLNRRKTNKQSGNYKKDPPNKVSSLPILRQSQTRRKTIRSNANEAADVSDDDVTEDETNSDTSNEPEIDDFEVRIRKNIVRKTSKRLKVIPTNRVVVHVIKSPFFKSLWNGETELKLPDINWGLHFLTQNIKLIVISEMEIDSNRLPKVLRQILLTEDLKLSYFVGNKRIEDQVVENFKLNAVVSCASDAENSILDFVAVKLCQGGPSEIEFPTSVISTSLATVDGQLHLWKHRNCKILTENDANCCKSCATLEQYFYKVTEKPFLSI